MTWATFKTQFLSLFGDREDTSGTYRGYVNRLGGHVFTYNMLAKKDQADMAAGESQSVPITERAVYICSGPETVREVQFSAFASSTVSASETHAWHLLVLKRGGSAGTYSTTFTTTTYIAGLSSGSDKAGTHTNSWSAVETNLPFSSDNLHMNSTAGTLKLKKGDVLTAQVLKGSGTATDSGAIFQGGVITFRFDEDDV